MQHALASNLTSDTNESPATTLATQPDRNQWNPTCRCKQCTGQGLGWITHVKPDNSQTSNQGMSDRFTFDSATGEMFFRAYTTQPYDYPVSTQITAQPSLSDCRSVDDFALHLEFVDKRKLPAHTLHQLRNEVDSARGEWYRTGVDCRITLPQQRLLEKLHKLVIYHNAIFMTQTGLAKALNVDESNLMKKLKVLEQADILRTSTSRNSNIRSREIKLTINPRLIFRGNDKARGRYIADWYKPVSYLHTGALCPFGMDESLAVAA